MVIRMRHTRSHRDNRRAHHALTGSGLTSCPDCGSKMLKHRACPNCGKYRGKQVVDTVAALQKKEERRKKKEKEAAK